MRVWNFLTVKMPPSAKTVTLQEDVVLRHRIIEDSNVTVQSKMGDPNNNNQYPIDDINYLRSETEKIPSQREIAAEEAKTDYSNWKAEIR